MRRLAGLGAAALLAGCATTDGGPVPAPRVDYHQHLVSPAFAPIAKVPPADGADLVRRLDAAGIGKAVVLSMGYSFGDERKAIPNPAQATRDENDWTSRQVTANRGRLIGFCGVNPLRDEALAEIDRCLGLPGMTGLKLHLGNSGVTLRDPAHLKRIQEVFALLNRRGAPALVHMRARGGANFGAQDAELFLDHVVPQAPRSEIVVAHFAGAGPGYPAQADELMAVFAAAAERGDPRMRNLYFDVATILTDKATPEDAALIAKRMRQVGMRRVLFGTDLGTPGGVTLSQAWELYRTRLGLTDAELRTLANNRTRFAR